MGRLEEAKGRLDRALERLETVAQQPVHETAPDAAAALAASLARCETLETQSRQVSDRLDAAIEQLQAVLKEDEKNGAG